MLSNNWVNFPCPGIHETQPFSFQNDPAAVVCPEAVGFASEWLSFFPNYCWKQIYYSLIILKHSSNYMRHVTIHICPRLDHRVLLKLTYSLDKLLAVTVNLLGGNSRRWSCPLSLEEDGQGKESHPDRTPKNCKQLNVGSWNDLRWWLHQELKYKRSEINLNPTFVLCFGSFIEVHIIKHQAMKVPRPREVIYLYKMMVRESLLPVEDLEWADAAGGRKSLVLLLQQEMVCC